MPSKQSIIDSIERYDARQIVDYIRSGLFTFDELVDETAGYLAASVRREVETMLNDNDGPDFEQACALHTAEAYRAYLAKHPGGRHVGEVRERLDGLTPPPFAGPRKPSAADTLFGPIEDIPAPPSAPKPAGDRWNMIDQSSIEAVRSYISDPANAQSPNLRLARKQLNVLLSQEIKGYDIKAIKEIISDIRTNKEIDDPNNPGSKILVIDPNGKILEVLCQALSHNYISTADVLDLISGDHNYLHSSVIYGLINEGWITYDELQSLGIDRRFISYLAKQKRAEKFGRSVLLERINKQGTEVYFWGIPSSGKTCALGAMLNVASGGVLTRNMVMDNSCQGYGYMHHLSEIFSNNGEVSLLPPGTAVTDTFEMAFDLTDRNDKVHPITCIDLAGEMIRCMYKSDAGEELTEDQARSLKTLTDLLGDKATANRKIHFFVLEYGGEDRIYEGLGQKSYLDASLRYIERTGILEKDTDAVFLIFTKVDKTGLYGDALIEHLHEYTMKHYRGFYQGLADICKKKEINGGRVERLPFTLGEVCFQDYCLFDDESARLLVEKLIENTHSYSTGKWAKLKNRLNR